MGLVDRWGGEREGGGWERWGMGDGGGEADLGPDAGGGLLLRGVGGHGWGGRERVVGGFGACALAGWSGVFVRLAG